MAATAEAGIPVDRSTKHIVTTILHCHGSTKQVVLDCSNRIEYAWDTLDLYPSKHSKIRSSHNLLVAKMMEGVKATAATVAAVAGISVAVATMVAEAGVTAVSWADVVAVGETPQESRHWQQGHRTLP
jgi:hypothetical protein